MRKNFLIFVAVVSVIYGVGGLVMPASINELHGLTSSPSTSLVTRYFGASLLGVGVMGWFAREAADSDGLYAMMLGGLVLSLLGLLVSLYAVFGGLMSAIGWVPALIQALLSLGFAREVFSAKRTG